ncbi:hypothetical protein P1J78_11885 [Psychromarinibacter sp. C21-152]|uniref:Uncharacterized protein n=1 Tax=Psychromarinibacter sediminicola TaxID=3033385 RepID=A0AAE3TAB1_9RHOB|nr:hypothetical protein [Psychromarinibacter sediminicola]MDF0601435.1 hypothetical protein [Psychromarinibacter sediminicola]
MDEGLIFFVTAIVLVLFVRAAFFAPRRPPPYDFRPGDAADDPKDTAPPDSTPGPDGPPDRPGPRPTYGAARYRTKRLKRGPSE